MKEKKNNKVTNQLKLISKNRNINIGLVLAIFVLLPTMVGIASAEIFYIDIKEDLSVSRGDVLINPGDTVAWTNYAGQKVNLSVLNENITLNNGSRYKTEFIGKGIYIYEIAYIRNNQSLGFGGAVIAGNEYSRYYNIHNNHVGYGTANLNCDVCHGFPPSFGTLIKDNIPVRDSYGNTFCDTCHPSMTPTPVVTITPVQTTVGPTVTATATAVPTVTGDTSPGHPEEWNISTPITSTPTPTEKSRRAILEVTNKIDRSDSGAIITVSVRNTGDDTARFVNFSSSIPVELGAELVSGADWNGNELIWKGDIGIGEKHDIIYKVKPVKIDINIPVKVTYVKDSITAEKVMTKAVASGMTESSSIAVDPQDLQVIYYVILITKAILPGFEAVLGILGVGTIYMLRRKNRT